MNVITANRLTDGRVIYWTTDDLWSASIADAVQFDDEAAAQAALTVAQSQTLFAVGVYLIDVEDGAPSGRRSIREAIRLTGPSAGSLHRHAE